MAAEKDDIYYCKVIEARNLEFEKKGKINDIYVRAKAAATGTALKTALVDPSKPTWNEEFSFTIPKSKVKKGADKLISFKLCEKGTITDDVIGIADITIDTIPNSPMTSEMWMLLDHRKGKGELKLVLRAERAGVVVDQKAQMEARYTVGAQIGQGGFSVVYEGMEKSTGKKVAIKVIDKKKQDAGQLKLLEREITIMQKLKHPNIVGLVDVFTTDLNIFMVLEFVSGGELYDQIIARGNFTEADASSLLRQILSATQYIHENGIAHRDLKPENLLLSNARADEVKIADFGLSKDFASADAMTTCCGSPSYVAPEVLQQGAYSNACDIWSIGVITYVLLCGFLPFFGETQEELFDKILTGTFSFNHKCWDDVSAPAKDLVTQMLTLDPLSRPTAKHLLEHQWFAGSNPRKQLRSVESLRDLRQTAKTRPTH
jgi:predicted Ser/Thr protein kinase